jgi:hypothetical protein
MEWILKVEPNFSGIQEAEIKAPDGATTSGWHASAISKFGTALGSGCHSNRDVARRIALAEMLERAVFKKLRHSPQRHRLLFDEFPSTSGFAAGFDSQSTMLRAVFEAHERWAWSKWVDDGFALRERKFDPSLPAFASELIRIFDQVRFFEARFLGEIRPSQEPETLHFGVLLGFKGNGVFPGSRVAFDERDIWSHAAVEAWRHYHLTQVKKQEVEDIIQARAHYFAGRADEVFPMINRCTRFDWPDSKLRILSEVDVGSDQFYMWRALAMEFLPWHLGDIKRFVY